MPRVHAVPSGEFIDLGVFGSENVKQRRVRAYVPAPKGVQRQTLILFDGQNVFGDEGSFSGGWFTHDAVDRLAAGRPIAPIVIAIDHGNESRIDELSSFSRNGKGGQEDAMLELIVKGILPAVHSRFDVQPWYHVIGGSSMGGLAALYAHFRMPEIFPGALCMSPSIWFTREVLFEFIRQQKTPGFSRLYLDCGAREARGQMLPLVASLASELAERGWNTTSKPTPVRLLWRPDKRGTHNEASWRRRLPKALRFLFG